MLSENKIILQKFANHTLSDEETGMFVRSLSTSDIVRSGKLKKEEDVVEAITGCIGGFMCEKSKYITDFYIMEFEGFNFFYLGTEKSFQKWRMAGAN